MRPYNRKKRFSNSLFVFSCARALDCVTALPATPTLAAGAETPRSPIVVPQGLLVEADRPPRSSAPAPSRPDCTLFRRAGTKRYPGLRWLAWHQERAVLRQSQDRATTAPADRPAAVRVDDSPEESTYE